MIHDAAYYEQKALDALILAQDRQDPMTAAYSVSWAQCYATLALAAATEEPLRAAQGRVARAVRAMQEGNLSAEQAEVEILRGLKEIET